MQRLRELMAHGGIAILAVVFALGLAVLDLARATAQEAVRVLSQQIDDPDDELGPFGFRVGETEVDYTFVLQALLTVVFIGAIVFVVWRVTRSMFRTCPECSSEIPRGATVCRYCTTELGQQGASK